MEPPLPPPIALTGVSTAPTPDFVTSNHSTPVPNTSQLPAAAPVPVPPRSDPDASLPSLLPSTAAKRADLVALKTRLASLLPPQDGHLYWNALVDFFQGKINRQELGQVVKRVLGTTGEAVQLHNALLLSILFNTSRQSFPPSSLRHAGWYKRKRDNRGEDGLKLQEVDSDDDINARDPKRRRIKATVMAIGKRERAELKTLGLTPKKDADRDRERQRERDELRSRTLGASLDSRGVKVGLDGLPVVLAGAAQGSAGLSQDYLRCLQTPLCCEAKQLPDADTLKDRMSLLAYDAGLSGGADARVAALGVKAVESHLRTMISSVISLVRSNRASGIQPPTQSQLALLAAVSSTGAATPSQKPTITVTDGLTTLPVASAKDLLASSGPVSPPLSSALSTSDFTSLFDISPGLLVQSHLAAIERLYAIPPMSDSESSSGEDSSDEEGDDVDKGAHGEDTTMRDVGTPASGSSNSRLGRSGSRSGPRRTNSMAAAGREQYLIDPSAVAIPLGHPDVTHPRIGSLGLPSPVSTGSNGETRSHDQNGAHHASANGTTSSTVGAGAGSGPVQHLSPKSLASRQQLFPEEYPGGVGSTGLEAPTSPHNETSTDGGSESEGERAKSEEAGRVRKSRGRKLWEVVDSVRLLDGVLDA